MKNTKIPNKRNILIMTLSALLYIAFSGNALASEQFTTQLNEKNIRSFLEEMRRVSIDETYQYEHGDIASYFEKHLAQKGKFESKTRFELPGMRAQDVEMKLDKEEFIAQIAEGNNVLKDYNATLEIDDIDIAGSAKSAKVETTIIEKGKMPWPDSQGKEKLISIEGISNCKQTINISLTNYIQLAKADCETTISFLPFEGRPLGD